MKERPYLLVDVDGVINALVLTGEDPGPLEQRFQVTTTDGRGPFTIRVPDGTLPRLQRLGETFEMVWATTWMDQAVTLLSPRLGVGEDWPFVDLAREVALARAGVWEMETWKLPGIDRWAAETMRPLAWLDDDLGADARSWARQRTELIAPTVVVPTDASVGLTDVEVDALLEWAGSLSAPYEILEHTADIGLRAHGRTLEEVFENAAWGTAEILGRRGAAEGPASPEEYEEGRDFPGVMASTDLEALLVDFLNEEVLWLLQDDSVSPRCLTGVRVARVGSVEVASPELGAEMDYSLRLTKCTEQPEETELKAVTYHQLAIRESPRGYEATVYFDV